MRLLPTRIHGWTDYLTGVFLVMSPWLLQFSSIREGRQVMILAGIIILLMALFTRYETGMIGIIPMKVHLNLDLLMGILIATSPWLLGFAEQKFAPHLATGIFEVLISLISKKAPVPARLRQSLG